MPVGEAWSSGAQVSEEQKERSQEGLTGRGRHCEGVRPGSGVLMSMKHSNRVSLETEK